MKRREFITFVVGVTIALPRAARAQQSDQRRHIGVMTGLREDDPENQARLAGFRHGLEKRGWSEGRNLRIDYRFAPAASPDQVQLSAKELVAMRPDVIFANATPIVAALQRETRAISIVFAAVADPIGSGFIASLPQPGGNITGVMLYEPSVTGKWLSMLKEIAPQLVRAAFLINPRSASFYNYYLRTAEPLSRSLGIDLVPTLVANTAEIEPAIEAFASAPNSGLVVPPDVASVTHRDLIVALAARHRLPAVYSVRFKDEREHATPIQSAKSVSKTTDRPQYRFRD
jgi:putative ABC transport system substrate-binding protein